MLTGGFYAEIDLEYDAMIAEQKNGRPFGVVGLRPIQMSTRDALERLAEGRTVEVAAPAQRRPRA